ncbi:MAG: hypothetical protein K8M05_13075 [Deltaproteobacteria bacterium]|nr:hypothetical protein [Kofleriaceae bacterium]
MGSLRLDKLFHVLVVLGAASCGEDDAERRDRDVDAAAAAPDASVSTPDGAASSPCFCDVHACCDRSGETPVLMEGFTCCWTTTCD